MSYVYRKRIQDAIGSFPIENHYTMDYWFLLRAYKQGKVRFTNVVAGTFFFDKNNKSADAQRAKAALRKVRNEFINENITHPAVITFLVKSSVLYFPKQVKRIIAGRA